jgi:hypothetical protein
MSELSNTQPTPQVPKPREDTAEMIQLLQKAGYPGTVEK